MNKDSQKGYGSAGIIFVLVWLAIAVGWVMNIIEIVATVSDPITGMFILRCVGIIVAPLGGVLGYF